jgi:CHAT domain-containing protein
MSAQSPSHYLKPAILLALLVTGSCGKPPASAYDTDLSTSSASICSDYSNCMAAGRQANQAETFAAAVDDYSQALHFLGDQAGGPASLNARLELALNESDAGRATDAAAQFRAIATLLPAGTPVLADPVTYLLLPYYRAELQHYQGLDLLNRADARAAQGYIKPDVSGTETAQQDDEAALADFAAAEAAYQANLPKDPAQNSAYNRAATALAAPTAAPSEALLVLNDNASDAAITASFAAYSPIDQNNVLGLIDSLRYQAIAWHDDADAWRLEGDNAKSAQAEARSTLALLQSQSVATAFDVSPEILSARLDRTVAAFEIDDTQDHAALGQLRSSTTKFTDAAAQAGPQPIIENELLQAKAYTDLAAAGGGQPAYDKAIAACGLAAQSLTDVSRGTSAALIAPCFDAYDAKAQASPGQADALHAQMFTLSQLVVGSETAKEIDAVAARLAKTNQADGALVADDQAAASQIAELNNAISNAATSSKGISLDQLNQQLQAAEQQKQADDAQLQKADPAYFKSLAKVTSAADVLRLLRPHEAFLGITSTPAHTWLFLLHDGSLQISRQDVNDAAMTTLVKAVVASNALDATGHVLPFDMADAQQIYQDTLAPFAATLPGVKSLVIAPSGPLLALPFALLPTQSHPPADYAKVAWLVNSTALTYVPAAANFVALRPDEGTSKAVQPWFGFGAFTFGAFNDLAHGPSCGLAANIGLSDLSGANRELTQAHNVFGGNAQDELLNAAFTPDGVAAVDLRNYHILHFATHGMLPSDLPCVSEPAIITATPAGATSIDSSLLTASTVHDNLHLDADLVILSACNTGGGVAGAEALSGLAKSFFVAGARALMVTQWDADDTAAPYLVVDTLIGLRNGKPGGVAGSLQAAQLDWIKAEPADAAPYYWAAYEVIGDSGQSSTWRAALSPATGTGL